MIALRLEANLDYQIMQEDLEPNQTLILQLSASRNWQKAEVD